MNEAKKFISRTNQFKDDPIKYLSGNMREAAETILNEKGITGYDVADLFKTWNLHVSFSLQINNEEGTVSFLNRSSIRGTDLDDIIICESDASVLSDAGSTSVSGGAGNDVIFGGNVGSSLCGEYGDDTIRGGNGNDELTGGGGNDVLYGGGGENIYIFDQFHGNDTVYCNETAADSFRFHDGSWNYQYYKTADVFYLVHKVTNASIKIHNSDRVSHFNFQDGTGYSIDYLTDRYAPEGNNPLSFYDPSQALRSGSTYLLDENRSIFLSVPADAENIRILARTEIANISFAREVDVSVGGDDTVIYTDKQGKVLLSLVLGKHSKLPEIDWSADSVNVAPNDEDFAPSLRNVGTAGLPNYERIWREATENKEEADAEDTEISLKKGKELLIQSMASFCSDKTDMIAQRTGEDKTSVVSLFHARV